MGQSQTIQDRNRHLFGGAFKVRLRIELKAPHDHATAKQQRKRLIQQSAIAKAPAQHPHLGLHPPKPGGR